jgi:hypothetical protein
MKPLKRNYKIIIRAAENDDYFEHDTDIISYLYGGEWITYKSQGIEYIVPKTNVVIIEITEA